MNKNKRIPWNKGLTKETDIRLLGSSRHMIENNPMKDLALVKIVSEKNKGKVNSPESIELWRKKMKGKTPKNFQTLKDIDRNGANNPMRKRASNLHWSWKDGITSLVMKVRHCAEYVAWRKKVLERDNYTCVKCSAKDVELETDHFPVMFSEIFKKYKITTLQQAWDCFLFWDINNGRTLCRKCHDETKCKKP